MGSNYQRLFYIFKNMDSNLGNPTGYIKVEINDRIAKLQVSLNNLVNRPETRYQLYGINISESNLEYTVICDIENSNGRADHKLSLDSNSIGSNKLNFDDINMFAVTAKMPDRYNSVVCPLVAYKNGELEWKKEFEAALRKPVTLAKTEVIMENGKDKDRIESVDNLHAIAQVQAVSPSDTVRDTEKADPTEGYVAPQKISDFETENQSIITGEGLESEEPEEETVGELSDLVEFPGNDTEVRLQPEAQSGEKASPEDIDDKSHDNLTSKFESTLTSKYNHESEDEELNAENDIIGAAEKNFRDISSISEAEDKVRKELDIDLLKEELDKSFEICNPFNTRSKRFKWWKINSPGYLNNILFRNNVKTYLLFNPKVMLAHYKYRYIIFGIRYDKYTGRERFVCGVPGVYSIDENPFGSMGSWAQLEGYKPKYGAFGYWIILIDPRTGKLIKIK